MYTNMYTLVALLFYVFLSKRLMNKTMFLISAVESIRNCQLVIHVNLRNPLPAKIYPFISVTVKAS